MFQTMFLCFDSLTGLFVEFFSVFFSELVLFGTVGINFFSGGRGEKTEGQSGFGKKLWCFFLHLSVYSLSLSLPSFLFSFFGVFHNIKKTKQWISLTHSSLGSWEVSQPMTLI